MKVLFCLGSLGKGGAERVVSILSNSFVEQDNDVTIVTTSNQKNYYNINQKIKMYALDKNKNTSNFVLKNIKRILVLKKIIKDENPDIIISFLPEPSYRILFLKLFMRKLKIIVSVRNDPKIEYKNILNKIVMKFLYPHANGFVFQTEDAKNYFNNNIRKKSIVIPNPIKKEFLEKKIYEEEKENIIVSVGRLTEQKNQELLIDAFYDINEDIPNYKLIIYGEGKLREKLEKKIKDIGMDKRILLPGMVDNISEEIEKAKLFVLSSNYEGMPNALMEAMALGMVCISTDCPCGGPKYLINNSKNGFLINVGDKEELKKKIKDILFNKSKTELKLISKEAKKSVLGLNEEKINETWYEFIKQI